MKRILNAEQMRRADNAAMEMGLPSLVLMERAALAVVDELEKMQVDLNRVCAVCGTGNNGGDGLAVARILCERGLRPDVLLTGNPEKYSEQMRQQVKIAENYPITFVNSLDPGEYTVIIDAIFGIGLHRPVEGETARLIERINEAGRAGSTVVSVDIPSGIHTDTGAICGTAVCADATVTFARGKTGLYLYPGAACAGRIIVREIGIPVDDTGDKESFRLYHLEPSDLKCIPPRDESGNKGTFRKILVIAGSESMCGAAYLSARAALMSGAGMVKIYTEESNRTPLSVLLPEALLSAYSAGKPDTDLLQKDLAWADGVVIGPGLGVSDTSRRILSCFLKENRLPCVMDADALNLLAENPKLWESLNAPCILTPHVGEMSRLTGKAAADIKKDPVATAAKFAREKGVVCILKDARSVTALPDGRCWLNLSGNSALSTAGSGDVLSGIAASLWTQHQDLAVPPAAMAAYIHGLCGETASRKYSRSAVTARNVLEVLPEYL